MIYNPTTFLTQKPLYIRILKNTKLLRKSHTSVKATNLLKYQNYFNFSRRFLHMSNQPKRGNIEDLSRVPEDKRIFSVVTYMLMWWSSVIVIQGFSLGQSMLPPAGQLNISQAVIAMLVASFLLATFYSLNGNAGMKYGIPFAVYARSIFGRNGSKLATMLRSLPALFWFGIGSWIGASAIVAVIKTLFHADLNVFVCFVLFQALQIILAAAGMKSIKWFESSMAIILVLIMTYMIFSISKNFSAELTANWNSAGSWGIPFITSIVALTGAIFTGAVNSSDLTRHLQNKKSNNWIGHFAGIPVSNCFLVVLGIMSGAAVGVWDPVQALIMIAPNTTLAMVLLIFIAVAQVTTNLTLNLLPGALTLMDFFKKLSWPVSVTITGVAAMLTCPWILFTSANFFTFINAYSAFLGPVLAVMLADYYFVKKQKIDVDDLYTEKSGKYEYHGGWNLAAIIAIIIGGIFGIIFAQYSWLVSGPVGLVVYMVLRTFINTNVNTQKIPNQTS